MVKHRDEITIVVNARKKVLSSKDLTPTGEISFKEVVGLAYDAPPSGPYIEFTVSYRNGAGRPPDGRLAAGQSVKIQNGTVFNVSYTDKS